MKVSLIELNGESEATDVKEYHGGIYTEFFCTQSMATLKKLEINRRVHTILNIPLSFAMVSDIFVLLVLVIFQYIPSCANERVAST